MGSLFKSKTHLVLAPACSIAALSLACGVGNAQAAEGTVSRILEEVEVTARKRAEAERLQEVPIAATAYSGDQLEALQTRDLESLAFKMPNVQMDDVGTIKSTANFTIRGLGVNSSIPSIDPTVGTFVDGMYMGMNAGVILDMFDIESIEVLRGPQGILFGRNVTGGAVQIRTARPTEEFTSKIRVSTTDHQENTVAAAISGGLTDSINGRLTAYYKDDRGYFENKYTGNDHYGAAEVWFVRPSFSFELGEGTDLLVKFESGKTNGDPVPGQNRGDLSPAIAASVGVEDWDNSEDSFELAIDKEGWSEAEWNQAITEFNHDVAFGNGTITNILAWREYESIGEADIDSLPIHAFHSGSAIDQSQVSNELRYAGRFGNTSITSGLYWLNQDLMYMERRDLFGALADVIGVPGFSVLMTGGGNQEHEAMGVFTQADIDLNDAWVLTLGGRYSTEEKDVEIASVVPGNGCTMTGCEPYETDAGVMPAYDFEDKECWSSFTPKVGLQWTLSDDAQVYSYWTKGFRSGGYNMRNTLPGASPGPTDQEEQRSFELGAKVTFLDGAVRTNMALFHNEILDMQREVNLSDEGAAVVQLIRNTANATIQGAEFEMMAGLSDNLLFTMNFGYVDGDYDDIWLDISGDGMIDSTDYALEIPRLAPWTYGAGLVHDLELGSAGTLTSRLNFNHRDASAYTDDNRGMLSEVDMLDFSIGYAPVDGNYRIALYGKNMLDEVSEGNDTQLPEALVLPLPTPGGVVEIPLTLGPNSTFTPLKRGRILGLEFTYEI